MQAIEIKTLPATNTKQTRVKAFCDAGSHTISYDYKGMQQCHQRAANELAERLEWLDEHELAFGVGKSGNTFAVLVPKQLPLTCPQCTGVRLTCNKCGF